MRKSAAELTKDIIDRAQSMRSYKVKMRVDDGWVPTGPVPFDIHIKNGIATLTVISNSESDAKNQASVYMESDDFYE
jgi:hypothetical protein